MILPPRLNSERPRLDPLAHFAAALSAILFAFGACSSDGDDATACVKQMNLDRVVPKALPESVLSQGWSSGGFGDYEELPASARQARDKFDLPEPSAYPHHETVEFRFRLETEQVEAVFRDVCDQLETVLNQTCDSVRRENLYLSCSFWTEDADLHGAIDVFPDSADAAQHVLIVVASEW